MQDLLFHPAIQAAIIPFIVSAFLAAILFKLYAKLTAISLLAGFIVTCILITDLQLQPLTSTKKLILLTVFAALLGTILQYVKFKLSSRLIITASVSLLACIWLFWPVLSRQEWLDAVLFVAPLILFSFVILTMTSSDRSHADVNAADYRLNGILYATTTSICCLIGASALYGQMAASLAAGTTAFFILGLLFKKPNQSTELFGVLLFLPISLIAVAATVYSKLPWYVLPILAVIPALLLINFSKFKTVKKVLIRSGLTIIPSGLALFLTWNAAGPIPF